MLFHGLATLVVRLSPIACAVMAALHAALCKARYRPSYIPVLHLAHRALLAKYTVHVLAGWVRQPVIEQGSSALPCPALQGCLLCFCRKQGQNNA